MKLRKHQEIKSKELLIKLKRYKCVYLFGEVRSGKTLTVLETAKLYASSNVLFVTKKKAISSIQSDFDLIGYDYKITIINYESLHKLESKDFDLVIYDEAHSISAFPKPSKRTKLIKDYFYNIPCILLSGTPSAESYSQYYHQFYVSAFSPFKQYTNFYKWSRDFVNVTEKRIGTHTVKDYSDANIKLIDSIINNYKVIMTQKDANFDVNINEHIINVKTPCIIERLAKKLIKDKAIEGKTGFIMGEMPAKLQSKVHQIYSGTCIIDDFEGNTKSVVLSDYKAQEIKELFKGQKIAIMYYYQKELEVLKNVFGSELTICLDEFNSTDKNFAIQQSSTEGMNISKAECLVYYNFGFSGKNYIQSRDRLTVKDRKDNNVFFIIETPGINGRILNAVKDKKDYNLRSFQKDFK